MYVAGDACFDHCSGWIIRGHSLLGSQREFKRELASDMPAIRQLLPEDQRSRGGIIHRDAWLHVLGSVVCCCSEKTLRRHGADSYHHELVLAVHNCALSFACVCFKVLFANVGGVKKKQGRSVICFSFRTKCAIEELYLTLLRIIRDCEMQFTLLNT